MDKATAQKLMEEAIKAMIDSGQYKVVQAVAVRSNVGGRLQNVTALLLGDSENVLQTYAERLENPTKAELERDPDIDFANSKNNFIGR